MEGTHYRSVIDLLGTHIPRFAARLYPDLLWRVPTSEKRIFLTFDDGPTPDLTPEILRILSDHDAFATFFLVGRHAARYPDLVRAMAAEGHRLGNHSYTHPDGWLATRSRMDHELHRTSELLQRLTTIPVRLMRPPYGRLTQQMRAWCRQHDHRMVMWDIMPGDYLPRSSIDDIAGRILHFARPGSVVVLHDHPKVAERIPDVLKQILPELTADGWQMEAL